MAADDTLDRLLTELAVRLHAFSVCEVQRGWRLAFPAFAAITVHYVLQGTGAVCVGNGPWLPFAAQSVIVVPARQPHVLGEAGAVARTVAAAEHCSLLGDGLVRFTAGNGGRDILLVCGTIPAAHGSALGLFDLLREPMVESFAAGGALRQAFELMALEVARPGLGTQAMTEVLMKQCLIALLRQHLLRGALPGEEAGSPLAPALRHPRLARAVLAIIEDPAAPHSVESLASRAGMSRASFAEHFSRIFRQGPIDFVQKVRLRVAARLLTTTDLPLKVVARSVGYAGSTPFSRAFRAAHAIGPGAYRSLGADHGEAAGGLAPDQAAATAQRAEEGD
ncbi:MAG: cupin domain-containing protein [Janthinobacterium lividum]